MKMMHTPGPWRAYEQEHTQNADHSYWHIDGGLGYYRPAIGRGFSVSGIMSEEDATLMAAAPELLEALLALQPYIQNYLEGQVHDPAVAIWADEHTAGMFQKAMIAMSKAIGEKEVGA